MAVQKLIISGLPEDALRDFNDLLKGVQTIVAPNLSRTVDKSVLARFAVTSLVQEYKNDPAQLARALGFEVNK